MTQEEQYHHQLGIQRLLKLANYLEINSYWSLYWREIGFVLSCCPYVFPDDWRFKQVRPVKKNPILKSLNLEGEIDEIIKSAEIFFNLTTLETKALFKPVWQIHPDLKRLNLKLIPLCSRSSKTKDAAANIRTFVAWKQNQLNLTNQ